MNVEMDEVRVTDAKTKRWIRMLGKGNGGKNRREIETVESDENRGIKESAMKGGIGRAAKE